MKKIRNKVHIVVEVTQTDVVDSFNPHMYEGSIWRDKISDDLYMFCQVDAGMFTLITLSDGNRVFTPVSMPYGSKGYDLFCSNLVEFKRFEDGTITIKTQ